MLNECKDVRRLNQKKHKLFENVSRQGSIQNILKAVEGGIKFLHFLSVFFSGKLI